MAINTIKINVMKRIIITLLITGLLGFAACTNQEKEFDDFLYTAVYFPHQYPVRTLSLGEDRIDNSLDKELKFHIGVSIGGMYENNRDWTVAYEVDETLAENVGYLVGEDTLTIEALPSDLYSIETQPVGQVTIPSGSFDGLILIQLNDAFLDDPLATTNHYVIPMRITDSDADSILTGMPAISDPDKRKPSDWSTNGPPKDFTLFMVKFVNALHGTWLHRGANYTLDASSNPIDTQIYREPYIVYDQLWELQTVGRNVIHTNGTGVNTGSDFGMELSFDENGSISVDSIPGKEIGVWETGENHFVTEGDSWNYQTRWTIYLNYMYNDGSNDHLVYDTLVFRDRDIAFETFTPVVIGD